MDKFIFLILVIAVILICFFLYISFFIPKELEIKTNLESSPDWLIIKQEADSGLAQTFLPLFEQIKEKFILAKLSFLEINLSEMKVRVYKAGDMVNEVPVLKKGDPQNWGGTAAGLYEVKEKYVNSFSVVAEVYMPWTVRIYGKYYLHGEPYYPGGYPLISSSSGGCVQLLNKNAKAIYQLTEIGMPIIVIDQEGDGYHYPKAELDSLSDVSAQSYLVADLNSGFVLADKKANEILPIASLTKLMTSLVVTENKDLKRWIEVEEKMLEAYGSTKGLEAGKEFRIVELLYPLLIESSNDASEVLAGFLGREETIQMMNEKAKAILMNNTKFTDPSGYNPANVSTVQDLFYLGRYIFYNRPPILEITKGKKVSSYGPIDFDIENLWNKNVFVNDPTFAGGKTGFTKQANYTGLFIFKLKTLQETERNIIIILLKSDNLESDAQKIYQWLQKTYFTESS